jgi:protocatechuate 3,4-dioxygenase beta subunit
LSYLGGVDSPITRRASLARLGGLVAAALGAGAWQSEDSEGVGPAAVASGAITCVLAPEQTEGPYYIEGERVRRNITDGRPGTPLRLRLRVVNASTCRPIRGAAVDIWHCDAGGVYSGFGDAGGNRTFMRGVQRTDSKGYVTFQTVYPGWYQGRTVHIHVKLRVGGNVVHTGQLYFPDAVTDAVYRDAPYSARPNRPTRNSSDGVYRNGGSRSRLALRRSATGWVGAITMGVHRS